MESPEAFVAGIGKGTKGLVKGFVSGAVTSTAAIVGTASKGVAKGVGVVSGDKAFVRQREEKRRAIAASSGGVLQGVKAGGESIFSGFKSGITGLVTKPLEEGI
jgi:vacuolar protein sorting-associated protein 13A/C